jgi:two-component system, sensor histidine kinase
MRGELDSIVAIIEDDQEVSEAMQILLESWGCRTFIAEEGDSLLQQLSAAGALPDVIITDLQLGDSRDGIQEVNRVCHHLDIKVPVLVVTGNIQAEQLAQVKASGLPLLYKPVAPAKLRAFLRSQYLKQKNSNS